MRWIVMLALAVACGDEPAIRGVPFVEAEIYGNYAMSYSCDDGPCEFYPEGWDFSIGQAGEGYGCSLLLTDGPFGYNYSCLRSRPSYGVVEMTEDFCVGDPSKPNPCDVGALYKGALRYEGGGHFVLETDMKTIAGPLAGPSRIEHVIVRMTRH